MISVNSGLQEIAEVEIPEEIKTNRTNGTIGIGTLD